MNHFGFAFGQKYFPAVADTGQAALGIEKWLDAAASEDSSEIRDGARELVGNSNGRRLLETIFGNSPYLTSSALKDLGFTLKLLDLGPDNALAAVMDELHDRRRRGFASDSEISRALRIAKRRAALSIAVADILKIWPLERITAALSDLAETALSLAVAHLLRAAADSGCLTLPNPDEPEKESGLIILAMGKLGARELNYSSDIDLIVFYDTQVVCADDPDRIQTYFVRLTRNLVHLIEDRTADGYVFRTDLRLRPDPGATPPAISVLAAETYYESQGQNWERAAMIKARPVAGDLEAGKKFLDSLKPFIWRKNLDFAAIQDIHSIKRQINAHKGGGKIALAGHNIKLGRGGIREIEFFAQTQQLIWGGRNPELRCRGTEEALRALAERSLITPGVMDQMIAAYRFLRRVEHHLQMIDDEQTQTLRRTRQGMRHLALFMDYRDEAAFADELISSMVDVETHYAELFEDMPSLGVAGAKAGNLVFTGADSDPETIVAIEGLGFRQPRIVDEMIRKWHRGHYRSTRSARTRAMLSELTPMLLRSLAASCAPDAAFLRFDKFLSHLPSGVQLFSMLHSNPHLLELLADIMGMAPRLAEHLSLRPAILDSVLSGDFFAPPPSFEKLDEELRCLLSAADGFEAILDISRRWANDRKFQVGVQILRRHLPPPEAALALSNIADSALKCLADQVEAEFAKRHGRIVGSEMVIVAMGKLGGREMTASSDLDLIFIYSVPDGVQSSDGAGQLSPGHYFARLSQRIINSVTAQTAEGSLYQVDMRLRPSGNAGPIASSLDAFVRYHQEAAWTWEHMALSRARVICGTDNLRASVEKVILQTLTLSRDADRLRADVAEMRERIDRQHHTDSIWEIKYLRGGLIDIEFIVQYLQLKHAHAAPEILSANTRNALSKISNLGLVDAAVASQLAEALELWNAIQCLSRLSVDGEPGQQWADGVPDGFRETLSRHCSAPDFAELEARIHRLSGCSFQIYKSIITDPAS